LERENPVSLFIISSSALFSCLHIKLISFYKVNSFLIGYPLLIQTVHVTIIYVVFLAQPNTRKE